MATPAQIAGECQQFLGANVAAGAAAAAAAGAPAPALVASLFSQLVITNYTLFLNWVMDAGWDIYGKRLFSSDERANWKSYDPLTQGQVNFIKKLQQRINWCDASKDLNGGTRIITETKLFPEAIYLGNPQKDRRNNKLIVQTEKATNPPPYCNYPIGGSPPPWLQVYEHAVKAFLNDRNPLRTIVTEVKSLWQDDRRDIENPWKKKILAKFVDAGWGPGWINNLIITPGSQFDPATTNPFKSSGNYPNVYFFPPIGFSYDLKNMCEFMGFPNIWMKLNLPANSPAKKLEAEPPQIQGAPPGFVVLQEGGNLDEATVKNRQASVQFDIIANGSTLELLTEPPVSSGTDIFTTFQAGNAAKNQELKELEDNLKRGTQLSNDQLKKAVFLIAAKAMGDKFQSVWQLVFNQINSKVNVFPSLPGGSPGCSNTYMFTVDGVVKSLNDMLGLNTFFCESPVVTISDFGSTITNPKQNLSIKNGVLSVFLIFKGEEIPNPVLGKPPPQIIKTTQKNWLGMVVGGLQNCAAKGWGSPPDDFYTTKDNEFLEIVNNMDSRLVRFLRKNGVIPTIRTYNHIVTQPIDDANIPACPPAAAAAPGGGGLKHKKKSNSKNKKIYSNSPKMKRNYKGGAGAADPLKKINAVFISANDGTKLDQNIILHFDTISKEIYFFSAGKFFVSVNNDLIYTEGYTLCSQLYYDFYYEEKEGVTLNWIIFDDVILVKEIDPSKVGYVENLKQIPTQLVGISVFKVGNMMNAQKYAFNKIKTVLLGSNLTKVALPWEQYVYYSTLKNFPIQTTYTQYSKIKMSFTQIITGVTNNQGMIIPTLSTVYLFTNYFFKNAAVLDIPVDIPVGDWRATAVLNDWRRDLWRRPNSVAIKSRKRMSKPWKAKRIQPGAFTQQQQLIDLYVTIEKFKIADRKFNNRKKKIAIELAKRRARGLSKKELVIAINKGLDTIMRTQRNISNSRAIFEKNLLKTRLRKLFGGRYKKTKKNSNKKRRKTKKNKKKKKKN